MSLLARVVATILLLSVVAACGHGPAGQPPPEGQPSTDPCAPWGCAQQSRFGAAEQFIGQQPGTLSIMVRDRETGAVWQAGDRTLHTWAGSTPKLALIVYLLEQQRAGKLTLSRHDRNDIDAILSVSDNEAADDLWDRYADSDAVMQRWQSTYGMTGASYVDGFPDRWGFVKLSAADLTNLMGYILDFLDSADRKSIVDRMRSVGGAQRWGVWGAGPALQPGVKDGWDYDAERGSDTYRWVLSTVGFAGPDERFIVAAMYDMTPSDLDGIGPGVHTITDLVATVFGAVVPAPVVVPTDY